MSDLDSSSTPSFLWRARISAAQPDRADVYVRKQHFEIGRPLEFDSDSPRVSAIEYLLGALGADLVGGLWAVARRRRLHLERAEAVVEGRLDNPLVHLDVVGEAGHVGLVQARVKVYASSFDPEESVRSAFGEAIERSPLVRTLRDSVDLSLELEVVV